MNESGHFPVKRLPARFETTLRVYYEDTDAAAVVYYANYLRFCERARTEWLRALGFEQQRMLREQGIGFVVKSIQAEYVSPARLDDLLTVVTLVSRVGGASIAFVQQVKRDRELLFDSRIIIACVDTARQRPTSLPADLRTLLKDPV